MGFGLLDPRIEGDDGNNDDEDEVVPVGNDEGISGVGGIGGNGLVTTNETQLLRHSSFPRRNRRPSSNANTTMNAFFRKDKKKKSSTTTKKSSSLPDSSSILPLCCLSQSEHGSGSKYKNNGKINMFDEGSGSSIAITTHSLTENLTPSSYYASQSLINNKSSNSNWKPILVKRAKKGKKKTKADQISSLSADWLMQSRFTTSKSDGDSPSTIQGNSVDQLDYPFPKGSQLLGFAALFSYNFFSVVCVAFEFPPGQSFGFLGGIYVRLGWRTYVLTYLPGRMG